MAFVQNFVDKISSDTFCQLDLNQVASNEILMDQIAKKS